MAALIFLRLQVAPQRRLDALLLGDILAQGEHIGRAGVEYRRCRDRQSAPGAVRVAVTACQGRHAQRAEPAPLVTGRRLIVGQEPIQQIRPDDLDGVVAKHPP